MVIIDTTVWIDYLGGALNAETEWLDRQIPLQRIALADMILCEVLQGIRDPSEFRRVRDQLVMFEVFSTGALKTLSQQRLTAARCVSEDTQSVRLLTVGSPPFVCLRGINCCTVTAISTRSKEYSGCR